MWKKERSQENFVKKVELQQQEEANTLQVSASQIDCLEPKTEIKKQEELFEASRLKIDQH